jgi:hypothetical protein
MRIIFKSQPEHTMPSSGPQFDVTPEFTGEQSETMQPPSLLSRQLKVESTIKDQLFQSLSLNSIADTRIKKQITRFVKVALDQAFIQLNLLHLNKSTASVEKVRRINETIAKVSNLVLGSFRKILTTEPSVSETKQLTNTHVWKLDLVTQSITQSVKELDQGVLSRLDIEDFIQTSGDVSKASSRISRSILENQNLFQAEVLKANRLSNKIRLDRKVSEVTMAENQNLNSIAAIAVMDTTQKEKFLTSFFEHTDLVSNETESVFIKNVTDVCLLVFEDVSRPRAIIKSLIDNNPTNPRVKKLASAIYERLHDPKLIHTHRAKFLEAASHQIADSVNKYHQNNTNPIKSPKRLLSAVGASIAGISALMALPLTIFADTDEIRNSGVSIIMDNITGFLAGYSSATGNDGEVSIIAGEMSQKLPSIVKGMKASQLDKFNDSIKQHLFTEGPQLKTAAGYSPLFMERSVFDYFLKTDNFSENNFEEFKKGLFKKLPSKDQKSALKEFIDEVKPEETLIRFQVLQLLIKKQFKGKQGFDKYKEKFKA